MIGRSRPRGPGTQAGLAGAGAGVGILTVPFLTITGEPAGGGRGAMDVTRVHVDGGAVIDESFCTEYVVEI